MYCQKPDITIYVPSRQPKSGFLLLKSALEFLDYFYVHLAYSNTLTFKVSITTAADDLHKSIAIDSRLSPAKVCWRQPAVSSELSLCDSQLKYMDGILTKIKIIKYNLLIFILFIHFRINIYMVLNINS